MSKTLFINACVRPESRTLNLANEVLRKTDGDIKQINLYETKLDALDLSGIEKRDLAGQNQNFDDPVFDFAKEFASVDDIVIAAPYWDMMFPAVLKTYLENVTVCGVTFRYTQEGTVQGLCKAKSLHYVTTAGGFIGSNDFGFSYVKALSRDFYGIADVRLYTAEGLDIMGADVDAIIDSAKAAVND